MISRKRRQIYLSIIGLGVVALCVDRFVLTGGDGVLELTEAAEIGDAPSEQAPVMPIAIPELPFPKNLERYAYSSQARDLFEPAEVKTDKPDETTVEPPAPSASDNPTPSQFCSAHTLGAVFVQEGLKMAVVDGQIVRLGETVDDCVLVLLTGTEAHFACGEAVYVLQAGKSPSLAQD